MSYAIHFFGRSDFLSDIISHDYLTEVNNYLAYRFFSCNILSDFGIRVMLASGMSKKYSLCYYLLKGVVDN